jgi:hypothetical protein
MLKSFSGAFRGQSNHQDELRSFSGVRIAKLDMRCIGYSRAKRDFVYPVRYILYSFRAVGGDKIHSLVCQPSIADGTAYDQALNDMAKSISY